MNITAYLPLNKTVEELATLVGGRAEGELGHRVLGAAGLAEAKSTDVSFLGNPKYGDAAVASQAGCLFLPQSSAELKTQCPNRIFVDDPQWAFAQVLTLIEQQRPKLPPIIDQKASLHYQTVLGPGVSVGAFTVAEMGVAIGEGSWIGPQVYLGENVKIGRHCRIYPQVVLRENCVIGDNVIIHSGTVVGADGFGFSTDRKTGKHRKIPQLGNVVIKDNVELGANVTIDRATTGSTVVESGTKVDNLVQLAHNVRVGRDCLLVSQVGVAGSCEIGDRVILAGQAGIAGHLKIGDGAVVMAQTGIMSDVEKGQLLFGTPARPHRESFKLQVLYGKLPELYEAVKQIKEKLGIKDEKKAPPVKA